MKSLTHCLRGLALVAAATAATSCNTLRDINQFGATADAEPQAVASAAVTAFEQMTIPIVSQEATAIDARVVGKNSQGDEIRVSVDREAPGRSRVWIRIGTFGDDTASSELWERIKKNL